MGGGPEFGGYYDKPLDVAPGSIFGIREWLVRDKEFLHSRAMQYQWNLGENIATCMAGSKLIFGEHDAPLARCSCGFYGYHDLRQTYRAYEGQSDYRVVGLIEAYGKVVIGAYGFRAEKARIVAFADNPVLFTKRREGILRRKVVRQHLAEIPLLPLGDLFDTLISKGKAF